MERLEQLRSLKKKLLTDYNSILLKQIDYINNDKIEELNNLMSNCDNIINNINKIDKEVVANGIAILDYNRPLKDILVEVNKNNAMLVSLVEVRKSSLQNQGAKIKSGRQKINQYTALNKKTSYGFNALK